MKSNQYFYSTKNILLFVCSIICILIHEYDKFFQSFIKLKETNSIVFIFVNKVNHHVIWNFFEIGRDSPINCKKTLKIFCNFINGIKKLINKMQKHQNSFIFCLRQRGIFSQHLSSWQFSRFALHSQLWHFYNQRNRRVPRHRWLFIKKKLLRSGVSPWGANISWFGVSTILNDFEMLSQASHPQPDPWIGTDFFESYSTRLSYEPNCLVTCWVKSDSSDGYYPPPLPIGARFSQ